MSAAGLTDAVHEATSTSPAVDFGAGLAGCQSALLRIFGTLAGVVYRPERERWGNYVPTVLARRNVLSAQRA